MSYPANGAGYDAYVWKTYFGERLVKTTTISRTATTIDMVDKLSAMDVATLTLDSVADVVLMRRIYASLDSAQKQFLSQYVSTLGQAENKLASLVVAMIADLSATPTLEDKQAVAAARAWYNKLNKEMKALVTNLSTLENAEDAIKALEQTAQDQPVDKEPAENGWLVYVVIALAVVIAGSAVATYIIIKKRNANSVAEETQKEDDHE
ncbi:MAG: hypothetical protein J6Q55_00790 [Clostridia bacterium]|nr:hypothetical protein [Clostridia bacterium]